MFLCTKCSLCFLVAYVLFKCLHYIYAFSRRFYPKWLTITFRLYIFYQYVCSLGIEPTTFCAADAMFYHWAIQELHIVSTQKETFILAANSGYMSCDASGVPHRASSRPFPASHATRPMSWLTWQRRKQSLSIQILVVLWRISNIKDKKHKSFELFCGVTDHACSRFASVQAKLGAYYRKFLILGLNLRYDVLN